MTTIYMFSDNNLIHKQIHTFLGDTLPCIHTVIKFKLTNMQQWISLQYWNNRFSGRRINCDKSPNFIEQYKIASSNEIRLETLIIIYKCSHFNGCCLLERRGCISVTMYWVDYTVVYSGLHPVLWYIHNHIRRQWTELHP